MRQIALGLSSLLFFVCIDISHAQVQFFVDDATGFNTARGSNSLAGTEDFESSTLGGNMIVNFDGPLAPGVMNTPFPNGTVIATGMTIQANANGGMPANTTTPAANDLATASAGFSSTPTDQISNAINGQSFDMIFAASTTTAVRFNPLVFDVDASGDAGTVTIRVFDKSNTLLNTLVDQAVAGYTNPTTSIGIVATGGEDIGRINVFATSVGDEFSGADNIEVYTGAVPVELMHFDVD